MLLRRIKNFCQSLRRNESGNALLLMALGMPVLIGSSGMAVDVAQWYMWKRELQYAVDQAALAGAWASAEPASASDYKVLARLEFFDNLSTITDDVTEPVISLKDYSTGTKNSVYVTATTSRDLPFSQIMGVDSFDIQAKAQASFQAATNYTTCLLALDPDDPSSFVLGGSTTGNVTCGMGALSKSATAMVKNGNPNVKVNDLVSAGGIDSGLAVNGTIHQYISNLSDPFDGLTLPTGGATARTYSCGDKKTATTGTATIKTTTTVVYSYWQGKNKNSATSITYTGTGYHTDTSSNAWGFNQTVPSTVYNGYVETVSETADWTGSQWNTSTKNVYIYEKKTTTVTKTYSNVVVGTTGSEGNANNLWPGVYSNISVACTTFFNPGVYYITGSFDLGQNQSVTGSNVLFIFSGSNSENFKINSQSKVDFTGITEFTLKQLPYSMSQADAEKLAGMIIYDPNSTGDMTINGGANVIFDGIIYAPKRTAKFNGNSSLNGDCMMIAAGKVTFTGTNDFSSFCVPSDINAFDIGGTTISVRLVA